MPSYITIQLPDDFVHANIDPLVKTEKGYKSRAEVVKAAVRLLNEQLKKQDQEPGDAKRTLIITGQNITVDREKPDSD